MSAISDSLAPDAIADEMAASGKAYEKLGLEKTDVIDYALPGGDQRSLIIYRKMFDSATDTL